MYSIKVKTGFWVTVLNGVNNVSVDDFVRSIEGIWKFKI